MARGILDVRTPERLACPSEQSTADAESGTECTVHPILYRHLGDEMVCLKEITIHMSLYTLSQGTALEPNSTFSW